MRMDRSSSAQAVVLAAARVLQALFGVLQLSVLARLLDPVEYGAVATAIALISYIQIIAEPPILGYERLGNHEKSRDKERGGPRSVAQMMVFSCILVLPVISVIYGLVSAQLGLALSGAVWGVAAVQQRWIATQYLNWNARFSFAALTVLTSASRTVAMIAVAYTVGEAEWVLLAGALASIVVAIALSPTPLSLVWNSRVARQLFSVGLPLALSSAAVNSMANWPIVAGSHTLDALSLASYAAQSSLSASVFGATAGFVQLFGFPAAKRAWDGVSAEAGSAVMLRYFYYVSLSGSALVGLFWFAGDSITSVVLGANYVGHLVPTAAMATMLLGALSSQLGWRLRLRFQQGSFAAITLGAAALQVPVVWLGSVFFGIAGLIAAGGLVQSGRALAMLWASRERPLHWYLAIILLCSVVIAGVVTVM